MIELRGNHPWLNFSRYKIRLGRQVYESSEHLFQALKSTKADEHEYVRRGATARDAKDRGRDVTLRKDWEHIKVAIMVAVLILKFAQNRQLRRQLLETGNEEIVEARPDPIWGIGKDGNGKNLMGQALMLTRAIFIASKNASIHGREGINIK